MKLFKSAIILGIAASAALHAQYPYVQQSPVQQAPAQQGVRQPGPQPVSGQTQVQASQGNPGHLTVEQLQQAGLSQQDAVGLLTAYDDTANVAAQWLKLLDDGRYDDSWDYASPIFQFTIKKNEWNKAQQKLRAPFGRLISRQLVQQMPAKDPKGLPKGDYMVLGYQSAFSNRPEVRELVTMVKDSDGKWRVLTYQAA